MMKPTPRGRKTYVEKMGTVTINMADYEKAGADADVLRLVINKIEDLPPLPFIVHKILSLTQDKTSNTSELAQVLSNDQALAAKVLRIANSPLYHVSSVVTSISHAVALLGYRTIRNLAMGISTIDTFNQSPENPLLPRDQFWEHSLATALGCKALANRIRYRQPDEAFVGGLLHDIGRMVFNHFFPESFSDAIREANRSRQPLEKTEQEEIGISHALVGRLLLQKWNLPPALADGVANHHDPPIKAGVDPSRLDIAVIIMVADALTKIGCIGFGGDPYIHHADPTLWRLLPLDHGDYGAMIAELFKNVQEIKGFFGIKDGGSSQPQSLPDQYNDQPLRLTYCGYPNDEPFVPARLLLQRFFQVSTIPGDCDIRAALEHTKPDLVFADLSSETRSDKISEGLKAYRRFVSCPIIFLLSRRVAKDTQEKSARLGMYFLRTPICPQEMVECLTQTNLFA
jgi:putative nucleotidyltransferase with HDIG domain